MCMSLSLSLYIYICIHIYIYIHTHTYMYKQRDPNPKDNPLVRRETSTYKGCHSLERGRTAPCLGGVACGCRVIVVL